MTSTSQSSTSTITVYLRQNYDTSKAAAEINIKVNSVLNQLPTGSLQPTITVKVGQTIDAMYHRIHQPDPGRESDHGLSDRAWCSRKLQAVEGVQTAEILGGQTFSLRAWLDPKKLEAYGMTASDVAAALAEQRLHLRGRQHQGSDDSGDSDLDHQPAFPRGVPQSRRQSR